MSSPGRSCVRLVRLGIQADIFFAVVFSRAWPAPTPLQLKERAMPAKTRWNDPSNI